MTGGFSDRKLDLDVRIGHVAGLRWFTLTDTGSTACPGATVIVNHYLDDSTEMLCSACSAVLTGNGRHPAAGRGRLSLRGAYAEWDPGENTARCLAPAFGRNDGHASPPYEENHPCYCGYWAYWDLGDIMVSTPAVVGLVHGYGHVIGGSLGFRCSQAAVKALFLPTPDDELQLAAEEQFGVPVYSSLPAMLAMHPAPEGQPALTDGGWRVADGTFARPHRDSDGFYGGGVIYSHGGTVTLITGNSYSYTVPGTGSYFQNGTVSFGYSSGGGGGGSVSSGGYTAGGNGAPRWYPVQAAPRKLRAAPGTTGPAVIYDEVPAEEPALITGADALEALHGRREKWAGFRDASLTVTGTFETTAAADEIIKKLQDPAT